MYLNKIVWSKQIIGKVYKWQTVSKRNSLNGPVTIKNADLVVKSLFFSQGKGPGHFSGEFGQMLIPKLSKLFQTTEKRVIFILFLRLMLELARRR